jgi:hypothetical protein
MQTNGVGRINERWASETEVLLRCARQRLEPAAAERLVALCGEPTFRWDLLLSAAMQHRVAPITLRTLEQAGASRLIPHKLLEQWAQHKLQNISAKRRQADYARKVLDFLATWQTRVMLVKGAALDVVVYDKSWYTQSDDMDLMIDRRWTTLTNADKDALEAVWRGSSIEFGFSRHHDLDMNGVLDVDYTRMWADARPIAVFGAEAYVMSPEDMLLSAAVNLCRKRYALLKGMMAVREVVLAHPGLDWRSVCDAARASGANGILYGALAITDRVLGLEVPDGALATLGVDGLLRATIDRLTDRRSVQVFRIPGRQNERLVSESLMLATYRFSRLLREIRAQFARAQERKHPTRFGKRSFERAAGISLPS